MEKHLDVLRDFVEGRSSHAAWLLWWREHAVQIEAEAGHETYLRFKFRPMQSVRRVLDDHGVDYKLDESKCQVCGEELLRVRSRLSREELEAFVRRCRPLGHNSTLIARDAEIGSFHPGDYCPNGCTFILIDFRRAPNPNTP